jgi:hypothetical protein
MALVTVLHQHRTDLGFEELQLVRGNLIRSGSEFKTQSKQSDEE